MLQDIHPDIQREKLKEIYNKYQYQIEALGEEAKKKAINEDLDNIKENDEENKSNFSASFYGPLFTSGVSIVSDDLGIPDDDDKDHRYYFVWETHSKM